MSNTFQIARHYWRTILMAFVAIAVCYTYWQLKRVEQDHLFAFALPWDRPATSLEFADAERSAQTHLFPAMIAVITMGGVALALLPRLRLARPKLSQAGTIATALFLLAALADLATTLMFFHRHGVNYELHPGIRLFGYAYGLTIGPLSGKLVQAVGILLLAQVAGRWGILLLAVVTIAYGLAAMHNYQLM